MLPAVSRVGTLPNGSNAFATEHRMLLLTSDTTTRLMFEFDSLPRLCASFNQGR
jgi:hypothetical protein